MGHEKHEQLIKLRNQKQKTEKLKEATLDWLCEINKPKAKLENSDRRQATEETEDKRQWRQQQQRQQQQFAELKTKRHKRPPTCCCLLLKCQLLPQRQADAAEAVAANGGSTTPEFGSYPPAVMPLLPISPSPLLPLLPFLIRRLSGKYLALCLVVLPTVSNEVVVEVGVLTVLTFMQPLTPLFSSTRTRI